MTNDRAGSASAWAPLQVRAFRALWIAQLFSMIGTWMQTVGAQWLLVDEPNAATLVGMVQAAALLPTLVLALPAGALADIVDRRRLLVTVQVFQVVVAAGLTVLAVANVLTPALLLGATFLLGVGTILTVPAYQVMVQDLVGKEQVRSAAALNGVAVNLARAIGPAIAGLLVAQIGVAAVFALNAVSYLASGVVLLVTRSPNREETQFPERLLGAVRAGTRYVRHSLSSRRLLFRTLIFVLPAAALWALLPLVANSLLRLDALGYGVLLGALGVGAITGAVVLPRVSTRLTPSWLVVVAGLVFGAATAVSAVVPNPAVVVVALVPAGMAWLCALATMNSDLSVFLPGWVRARGLSIYQMVFAGGQALAAVAWGVCAQWLGLVPTLLAAAVLLGLGAISVGFWPLRDVSGLDRDPAVYWPEPVLQIDPQLEQGPVLVISTYSVDSQNVAAFLAAMQDVRRMKLRTGASSFSLYQDGASAECYVEVARYPSWAEHLRQHGGRLTGSDRELENAALQWINGKPAVQHLLPAGRSGGDLTIRTT